MPVIDSVRSQAVWISQYFTMMARRLSGRQTLIKYENLSLRPLTMIRSGPFCMIPLTSGNGQSIGH